MTTLRPFPLLILAGLLICSALAHALPLTLHTERATLELREVTGGLEHPWALAFLPDGNILVTERPGRLRVVTPEGRLGPPLGGVPAVFARNQGGLLDVALAPDFASSRYVYLAYAEAQGGNQAGTAVCRGRLNAALTQLDDFEVIFRQVPAQSTGHHFGARLVFDAGGQHLFVALGEHNQRATAQRLDSLQGKVVRLLPDGGIPADNPFVDQVGARPEIWSYGHRNPQGAALHPLTGQLWVNEHGPRGGDEINLPQPGANYGWPLATHGRNYTLLPIPEAQGAEVAGTEPPQHVWLESPAVSGMAFYTAAQIPGWQGNLFVGALRTRELLRLELNGDTVAHEERLLRDLGQRIRDVRAGPDGALYLLTDANPGQLLRLGPAP